MFRQYSRNAISIKIPPSAKRAINHDIATSEQTSERTYCRGVCVVDLDVTGNLKNKVYMYIHDNKINIRRERGPLIRGTSGITPATWHSPLPV